MATPNSKTKSSSKAPANASAPSTTTEADVHSEHGTAGANSVAVSPPGTSEPGGTNTRSEESGDAVGATSVNPVKPSEDMEPTNAIPAEAATPVISSMTPNVEASAFGRFIFRPEEQASIDSGMTSAEEIIRNELIQLGWSKVAAAISDLNNTPESDDAAKDGAGDPASPANFSTWLFEKFEAAYPLTFAFMNFDPDRANSTSSLWVGSKVDGFRRGGIAHSKAGMVFDAGELTPDQIEAFLAEPMLTVEIV